jgi:regulatory protein
MLREACSLVAEDPPPNKRTRLQQQRAEEQPKPRKKEERNASETCRKVFLESVAAPEANGVPMRQRHILPGFANERVATASDRHVMAHAGIVIARRSRDGVAPPTPLAMMKAPTRNDLHEAALAYLARRPATRAVLKRVLTRKLLTWKRRASKQKGFAEEQATQEIEEAKQSIDSILERFQEVGLVNDEAFAKSRAKSLSRGGRSRRAIEAHLKQRGVAETVIRESVPRDASVELRAALVFARKRRLGPFQREVEKQDEDEPASRSSNDNDHNQKKQKSLATMARAGFAFSVCERALEMDRAQAEEILGDQVVGLGD